MILLNVDIYPYLSPRELSSVDKDNALIYMQGPEFKPRPPQKISISHLCLVFFFLVTKLNKTTKRKGGK